jgi:hypothetical protein
MRQARVSVLLDEDGLKGRASLVRPFFKSGIGGLGQGVAEPGDPYCRAGNVPECRVPVGGSGCYAEITPSDSILINALETLKYAETTVGAPPCCN